MASRIAGITVEIGGDTTKLSKALESVNKTIKTTQSELKDVNKLLKLDPSNTEAVTQKQRMLKDAIEATKEKLTTLKTAAEQANQQLADGKITQDQYDALQREIVETEQNLRSLQEQAAVTNTTLAKIDAVGEKLQTVGSQVEGVGKKFLPVTAAVTGLGTAAVKTAADFDQEMSKVAAISGATGSDFDSLREKAREMGAKTKFSASEAASAMEYMAMAGWKTGDMLDGIEGIMNLAAASGEDLATTSDIVTDALTAFGLSASDSGHFADILAAASSNANTNVSMMGETFKYCAPIAGALGFSAEDTAEAIGLMANSGIKASQAGTSLRSIMNNLAGEVTFAGKNIGEVTIATSNADGSMRSLNDILADCRVAFSGLTESEKAANAESLVGKNAMSGFLALMNSGEGDINKLRGAIENCDGSAESMAETMQDNLNGQLTILKSQLEELAISFGDLLMPTIRKIVSAVQAFVDKLNSMDDSTRETILKVAALAAAIGPLLIVLGKTISTAGTALKGFSSLAKGIRLLSTRVGSASGLFGKLGAALGGISAPVMAVVAVIGTLVAAFMHLWNTNEEFRTAITNICSQMAAGVRAAAGSVVRAAENVASNLEQTSSELTGKVEQAKSDLNTGRQELKDAKDTLNKRMDSIAGGKTSDAEILDARVDADGNTHENLGAHIRSGFESARADQEEAVNHIGRMAAVSDAMRTANMVHTVDFSASNTSGDVKATAVSLGHGDRAGVIINGALKEGENDVSVLRFTEPMAFKAGTPYTVFIDETTPKVGYGIYFYEVGTGNCLQVGGINRGFTPANTKIATAVFDNGGMFRAGIYSTNCEFENHEIHLYVVEGEYTRKDFYGLLTAVDVPNNAAAIAAVRDDVRKNNLIAMKNVLLNDEAGEPFFTSMPVGVLNFGGTVLNGRLGPTVGTYAVQFSSPFMLEKEKDYTLFVLDEHKDLDYSVYLLDETTWKDVMENGTTRAFNVIHSPCGVIPAHSTGKHQLRIWAQQDTIFENRAVQVYLVEGRYTETELRTYLPAKEASSAMNGLSENLNAVNRVSDTLRRNNLVHTVTCQATGSDGTICATATSLGVHSGTVISGSLGPKQGKNTLYFGEYIWLDKAKTYTLYLRADEEMPECSVFFYGSSKDGCLQVEGNNQGFSVHNILPQTFTPDESCYYRPGVYTSRDLDFSDYEMHLFVLEGVYTYDSIRGQVEFNDLNDNFTSMSAVRDSLRCKNLIRTVNYSDSNSTTGASVQMIADGECDQTAVKIVGNMGGNLALNSLRCTSLMQLKASKAYTLFVRADEGCPTLTAALGDEVTYGFIQINGASVSVDTVNRHCYSFTADKDYSCRVRIICNTATMFTGQKIHLYLVEGSYAEEQIRSWAGYDELLQVEEDADQKIQNLTDREDARWGSTHDGLENILTVSDRARKNNMIKMIDSSVRNSAGEVSATATALGILDRAGVVVNGIMSGEMGAAILKISEPMHLEQGKTYTAHIVDDDPPVPYSMFFYKIGSSVCLQQGGSNRGVSAIGSRFEQVIPDVTGDYQMGVYSTAAVFSSHMIHAYMYEGTGWSMDDFYAYPKSDILAATISEMAAVKDSVRKKNLVKMLSTKGFLDGTGVYRLNSIGMPDPAGIMLNGTFGTTSTTMYTNIC